MAYSDIDKPSDYFNTVLYTGNGSTNAITGVGFQPSLIWTKSRTATYDHFLTDEVIFNNHLRVNKTDAENTGVFSSIDSDGFTLIGNSGNNTSGASVVAWNWLAGGTASSNTDGSITSQVSANTTSGFSIVSYSGNSTGGATVGHSLGATPSLIIVKDRTTSSYHWQVYHKSLGATKALQLSLRDAEITGINRWNNTEPTSSVFTLGSSLNLNGTGQDYIAYCFAPKAGFSAMGQYTGNGSTDGTFVYTGFKPAMIIAKNTESTDNWVIMDNKRANAYNPQTGKLLPNQSSVEDTTDNVDFLSNGFKLRETSIDSYTINRSGDKIIYMAFASEPLVGSNNVCATAR